MLFSWEGLDKEREELHRLAREYVKQDKILAETMDTDSIIGYTLIGYKEPRTDRINPASKALTNLINYHSFLMKEFNLNWDFIHLEWAPILNPNAEELERCKKAVNSAKYRKK